MATTPSDGMDWISLEDSLLDDTNSGQPLTLVKTSGSGEDPSERIFCLMCTGGSRQLKIAKVSHVVVLTDVRYYPNVCNLRRRLEGGQPRVLQQLRNYWAASSVGTLSLCLAFGGCAVVTTTADAAELRRLVISERVDVVGMVPDQLRLLAEDPCKELPWMRLVMTWGERFPGSLVDRWRGHPGLVLELFAATEFWLGFVGQPVAEYTDRGGGGCLLRSAGSHVSYLVLDDAMMPVPEGDVGELFLAGPFVIPGYVDEATTEASFLSIHGQRYYRTRDRVLVAPGGIIYHSRADHRAKRGGQWVDLAVTEKALQGIVGIKEVCAVEDNSGLCAFLSIDASCLRISSGLATAAKAIRRVRELLPSRSFLQLLPELPRNPTGKIHLQALEQRWEGQSRARQAKAAQPHLRQRLQAVCCQHALCGIAALFIAVGGDAFGAGLRQLSAQGASQLGTTQWPLLRALGMAYSWLAMAQLSHSSVRLNAAWACYQSLEFKKSDGYGRYMAVFSPKLGKGSANLYGVYIYIYGRPPPPPPMDQPLTPMDPHRHVQGSRDTVPCHAFPVHFFVLFVLPVHFLCCFSCFLCFVCSFVLCSVFFCTFCTCCTFFTLFALVALFCTFCTFWCFFSNCAIFLQIFVILNVLFQSKKSKNPKIQKSKNPKVQKSKNPKIPKPKNPKVQKSKSPKIQKSKVLRTISQETLDFWIFWIGKAYSRGQIFAKMLRN